MSATKAVIGLTEAHGRATGGNALSVNAGFITDYAFAAQSREFRNEATLGFSGPSIGQP